MYNFSQRYLELNINWLLKKKPTKNYSCRRAYFQRFISVSVDHTVVLELYNRSTILFWCYSATIFPTSSNVPFCVWSWTRFYDCHTVDGFLAVYIVTFTHLLLEIVCMYEYILCKSQIKTINIYYYSTIKFQNLLKVIFVH